MKFQVINRTLIAASEEASRYLSVLADMGFVELFGLENIRTKEQNKKLWPLLTDISKHVVWFGKKHKPDTWKHIISAAWRNQQFVQGIGDTLVVIPVSTSKLNKREFSELIECIYVFGGDQGVPWSDPAMECYETYREAK